MSQSRAQASNRQERSSQGQAPTVHPPKAAWPSASRLCRQACGRGHRHLSCRLCDSPLGPHLGQCEAVRQSTGF